MVRPLQNGGPGAGRDRQRTRRQGEGGEAQRIDSEYSYVAAWEYQGDDKEPKMHKEELKFENVEVKVRSYK